MKPVEFSEQNIIFTKPESMTDEECGSMPAFKGQGHIVCCWQLNAEEIEEVRKTGLIWVDIISNAQPPICLRTDTPFVESNEEHPEEPQ